MDQSLADYAGKNDVEKLRDILAGTADVNRMEYQKTALHCACAANAIGAAKLLIEHGAEVNLPDQITNAVPLHYCALYNHLDMARLILSNGGRLDKADQYGNEPLWTAVFNVKGQLERMPLVELYLQHGADKNHQNKTGRSPLDFALQVSYVPLLELLGRY